MPLVGSTPMRSRQKFCSIFSKSRRQGLDILTIKDLGRWEIVEMVQLYTRSVTFQDSLKLFSAIMD